MNKALKWTLIVVAALGIIGYAGMGYLKKQTKKHSPQDTVVYEEGDHRMEVVYCRPYKKGREIFGGLVPYGEVWRTGANEATTFSTNESISFGGARLDRGIYTLWTIPGEENWQVILNNGDYGWGVGFDAKAARKSEFDVASIEVPVEKTAQEIEQFTIRFVDNSLELSWENSRVRVPIATLE